ncbi:hypothetical protein B0H16DRAFT_1485301 [Mycena metata]|uniref:Uncharacterized protein n=1 Tax=Mycena metata TaxID=1033252 RepID=A0AAD7DPK8_9AGAR|nr:hypothetical protein B0H16DRAFT_1485301 [Mycena metata]
MTFVPPWTRFTLPRRGKVAEIDLDITDHLYEQYDTAARARNAKAVAAALSDDEGLDSDYASDSEMDTDSDSDSDETSSTSSDSDMSLTSASDSDTGSDYIPSPLLLWDLTVNGRDATTPILRPRAPTPASPDIDLHPFPDSFTPGHLRSLNFDFLKWNDQQGPFVDLYDRIGAMYIGSPAETLEWQRCIIQAGQDVLSARSTLQHFGENKQVHSIASGLQYGGPGGSRPQNMCTHRAIDVEHVVLALLRHSDNIQAITSFQNAALQAVAPRAWSAANEVLQTILRNDSNLWLPCDLPCQFGPRQPSAFSRLEFRFSTDGTP